MTEEVCPKRSRPWVLAATILGSSIAFIDSSVVSVALPAMQRNLSASVREAQWIANSYMLLLGALILVGGATGDRFGRRRAFLIGLIAFTAASVACGFAPDSTSLIVTTMLQSFAVPFVVVVVVRSAPLPFGQRP